MLKELKEQVGRRFKEFRISQKKAQHILAEELRVHQSTITNIEHGTTFPKINYLQYFYEKNGLNINWLVTGEGDMFMDSVRKNVGADKIMYPHVQYGDPNYAIYLELTNLMQVPVVEQVILAKLSEAKVLFKEQVRDFLEQQNKEEREKKKRAARAKVKK